MLSVKSVSGSINFPAIKSQFVTSTRVGKFAINLADCSDPMCLASGVQSNSCKVFLLSFEYLFTRAELGASHRE